MIGFAKHCALAASLDWAIDKEVTMLAYNLALQYNHHWETGNTHGMSMIYQIKLLTICTCERHDRKHVDHNFTIAQSSEFTNRLLFCIASELDL